MITAIDVGATKTLIAQFGESMKPINEVRFETNHNAATFLKDLSAHLKHFKGSTGISIGVPGLVENGVILRCGNLPWTNLPIADLLGQYCTCPIYVENDANLAALAEINALNPIPKLGIYLTVSTGIGNGVIINGKLLPELSKSEVGHMVFNFKDSWKEWEDIGAGKVATKHFGKLARELTTPEQWQWVADRLAVGLCALIPAFQPEVIVFGGGVGHYLDSFKPFLQEQLRRRINTYVDIPHMLTAKHPEEAVLYGCYYYATHQQANQTV